LNLQRKESLPVKGVPRHFSVNSKKKAVGTEMFAGDKNEYGGGSCAS
jgi:hypothetical protein